MSTPMPRDVQTYTGYLEIDPLVYGKAVQAVTVHTTDGQRIGLTVRYSEEHLRYANKKVVVSGYMTQSSSDPHVQSFSYFKATSLELAPGEKPHAVVPRHVPAPPTVRSLKEIKNLPGGWGAAVGKARYIWEAGKTNIIEKVLLTLSDGFTIEKHLYRMVNSRRDYADGATATLVCKYTPGSRRDITPFAFCRGTQPSCGMHTSNHSKKEH